MLWFTIVVLSYTTIIRAKECPEKPYTIEVKLENDLLSAYPDPYQPPVMNTTDVVRVKVELIPEYFNLDPKEESFYLHTWLFLTWTNPLMTWNPADYSGIESTTISSDKVWDPMLIIDDYFSDSYSYHLHSTYTVDSTGKVAFQTQFVEMIKCKVNMRRWPFDTQICRYIFGETIKEFKRVSFSLLKPSDNPSFVEPGPGWKLISMNQRELDIVYPCSNNTEATFHTIRFTFEIRREAAGYAAMIVVPCFTLASLTLAAQVLDLNEYPRFLLLLVSMFGHFYFLQQINTFIPTHGRETPLVIIFIFSSLIMTCISLLVSLFLKKNYNKKFSLPSWIILNEKKTERILEGVENDESVDSETSSDSVKCMNIMNGICVMIFFIAYLVLIFTTLPMSFQQI